MKNRKKTKKIKLHKLAPIILPNLSMKRNPPKQNFKNTHTLTRVCGVLRRRIKVGNVYIGGNAPISIQSMTNTDTANLKKTVSQIKKLEKAGCEIIRVAVPNMAAAKKLKKIKSQINIPLVADIHFSHQLALESIKQGVDKLRLNPGNINSLKKIAEVANSAKKKKIPIRIGVNAGSLEKDILKKYKNKATSQGMVESALRHIRILEKLNFTDIAISLKASDIKRTVEAYKLLSKKVDYPLHIGITEAGTKFRGTIMSAIGIGYLLYEGIGDTIRVSLTADPVKEIKVAREILKSLNLRQEGPTITSCPTCGRTEINLIGLTKKVEQLVSGYEKPIHIAVMGCVVNGPGESREADLAIIGGKKVGLICKKGKIIKKVEEKNLLKEFLKELKKV
ncbi:MAG: flavodoxin-dependent (E)-4-hydroxy-3-methylbut-2-enyl-diphosphate synthase [Patescibacteria group bacterium]|nr:flavodoxin-dependent (E)-4-hydroxy-3-methylbut-2-enyl-diphosphate synthase [Patescibacteria group bacterium]